MRPRPAPAGTRGEAYASYCSSGQAILPHLARIACVSAGLGAVVGPERRGGQPLAVVEVERRLVRPGVADRRRRRDPVGADPDRVAVDPRLGGEELEVRAGDLEAYQRPAPPRHQSAPGVPE